MKLKSALPKGTADGISQREPFIDQYSDEVVYAIIAYEPVARTVSLESGFHEITLAIAGIEVPLDGDRARLVDLMRKAHERRTGEQTLDFGDLLDETLNEHAGEFLPDDTTVSWADPKTGEVKTRRGGLRAVDEGDEGAEP